MMVSSFRLGSVAVCVSRGPAAWVLLAFTACGSLVFSSLASAAAGAPPASHAAPKTVSITPGVSATTTVQPVGPKAKWTVSVVRGDESNPIQQVTLGPQPFDLKMPGTRWQCQATVGEADGRPGAGIACRAGDLISVLPVICTPISKFAVMNIASGKQIYTLRLICELPDSASAKAK